MSKRSFEEYAYEDDHLCEPDFSIQAFLPHHQTTLYDSDHVHLNYYESSLKKKKFDHTSLFSIPSSSHHNHHHNHHITNNHFQYNNNNNTTTTTLTNTTHDHHHLHCYPSSQIEQSCLYIQPFEQQQQYNNSTIMEDELSSLNIHDSYVYRKHLQHVEYLRATVINQQQNNRKNIINFQVRGLSGHTITFNQVDIESSTLFDLQQIINEQLGIPIPKQRIVLKGRLIPQSNNSHNLRLCEIIGIENNCIFQIVCALKGG